jgi:hypothetical protein
MEKENGEGKVFLQSIKSYLLLIVYIIWTDDDADEEEGKGKKKVRTERDTPQEGRNKHIKIDTQAAAGTTVCFFLVALDFLCRLL